MISWRHHSIDKKVEFYRKRCYELDPHVNRPGDMDGPAVEELRSIVAVLQSDTT